MLVPEARHPGYTPRRTGGLTAYERALARAGLTPVAGIDEAGRGACAGPLVVAAVCLDPARLPGITGIADSKALSPAAREDAYAEVMTAALAWHAVVIPPQQIDRLGLHVCNISGMRRALAGLACRPAYVLTDGFPVRGLGVPALAMWKGDEVAACVAAASVVAKVTRDRLMCELHTRFPVYGFDEHKGYSTRSHMRMLGQHGPCPEHRYSFVNVRSVSAGRPGGQVLVGGEPVDPAALTDDPAALTDGPAGFSDGPAAFPDGPAGLPDSPAGLPGGPAGEFLAGAEGVPVAPGLEPVEPGETPVAVGSGPLGRDAPARRRGAPGHLDAEQEN
ncbi:MAG TPA: ribonuclease HII [Streptosporangiaceae bacterium]|jgi:ribonuclease HII